MLAQILTPTNNKNKRSKKKGVAKTTSEDAMLDVINYAESEDILSFRTDDGDDCEPGPSGSTQRPQPSGDNIMTRNRENYSNQFQVEDFMMIR